MKQINFILKTIFSYVVIFVRRYKNEILISLLVPLAYQLGSKTMNESFPDSGYFYLKLDNGFVLKNEKDIVLMPERDEENSKVFILKGNQYSYGLPFIKNSELKFSTDCPKISVEKSHTKIADMNSSIEYFYFSSCDNENLISFISDNFADGLENQIKRKNDKRTFAETPEIILKTPLEMGINNMIYFGIAIMATLIPIALYYGKKYNKLSIEENEENKGDTH